MQIYTTYSRAEQGSTEGGIVIMVLIDGFLELYTLSLDLLRTHLEQLLQ
jgi:hypothetical protein